MIDTQALRDRILDLAMKGKLVPQDPNDEPASELLKRMKDEKEELIQQKKIKRDKNETEIFHGDDGLYYEKFSDGAIKEVETPYALPAGWEWARIVTVTKSVSAGGDKPKEVAHEKTNVFPFPIYSNGVKNNGLYGWSKEARIHEPSVTVSARGTIGFTAIRSEPYTPIVRLISIIPIKSTLDIFFLKYMLSYLIPTGEGTSIPQLTVPGIKPFLIAVPPYIEQLKIVEQVKKQFKLVEEIEKNQQELQQLADQLKKKVLDVAMQGKLVPQDPNDEPASVLLEKIRAEKQKLYEEGKLKKKDLVETEIIKGEDNVYYERFVDENDSQPLGIHDIPSGWLPVHVGNILSVTSGKSLRKNKLIESAPITVYGANGVIGRYSEGFVPKGTLLIGRVGFYAGSIHRTAEFSWVTDNSLIVNTSNYLNTNYLELALRKLKLGSLTSQTAQPVISGKKIYSQFILLPPIMEQERIVKQAEQTFDSIKQLCQ